MSKWIVSHTNGNVYNFDNIEEITWGRRFNYLDDKIFVVRLTSISGETYVFYEGTMDDCSNVVEWLISELGANDE